MKTQSKDKSSSSMDGLKYQKDAIVSKEILNKKSGTITLFAFDKNQSLSEHTAAV